MSKYKHFRTIVTLGLPLMFGSILQLLMHTMDVYFISQLGKDYTAASSMGASIAGVLFVFSMLVSTGAVALVARKIGQKNFDAVKSYGFSSLLLALVIGAIISLLGRVFSTQIISIYNPEPYLLDIIKAYVDILFAFTFVVFLNTTLRSIIQAMGNTKVPLYVFGTANLINIILDYMFIVVFEMGIRGAAIATVISQIFAAVVMVVLIVKTVYGGFGSFVSYIGIRLNEYKDIFSIGIWACIQSIARPITGLIMMRIVYSVGGTSGSAAFGIGLNIVNYFFIVLTGLSGAITILVGQKIGEGHIEEAKAIVSEGRFYSIINLLIFSVPYLIFTKYLFMPFNPPPEVLEMGVNYIRIVFIGFVVLGDVFMYRGAFGGAGDTYPPMLAALFANVICKLSLAIIFTSVIDLGINGVWYAIMASIFAEWLVITIYYKKDQLYTKVIGNH